MANEFIARNGLISQNNSTVTGSLTVTQGITGSLFGTASYISGSIFTSTNRALSSSYALTASYALNISDTAYDATSWNGVTDVAPSKNAVRDKIESTGLQQILDIGRTATLPDDNTGVSITLNSPDITVISATGIGGTNAIKALTDSGVGVYGQSSTNYGVHGYSDGFAAIFGESNNGHGVYAQSTYNVALVAYGSEPEVNIADFYGGGGAKVSIKYDGEVTASRVTAAKVTATSITGSLFGTATNALTASFAPSYVLTSSTSSMSVATASFITGSIFTSANRALSASNAISSSYALTASFVNPLNQTVTITGSLLTTGDVGLGTSTPVTKLHVEDSVTGPISTEYRSAAFIYNTSTDLNYANSIGLYAKVATYGGSAVYGESVQSTGYGGYFIGKGYFSGDVGLGTSTPTTRLHVVNSTTGPVSTDQRAAIYANNTSTDVIYANAVGVYAKVATTNGIAVYGSSTNSNGYGGYFEGKGYFSENVGIGKEASSVKLDVNGSTTITGSLNVTQGITGSLFGTSSWAISSSNSISASYVNLVAGPNITINQVGSQFQISGSAGGGGGGSTPVKLTSQTILSSSWVATGSYYTSSFTNSNITTTCDISITPQPTSYQTAYNAQILPYIQVITGTGSFYSNFPPEANMIVDVVITQTT